MELKDFISQTLVEIQAGVQDAINKTIANQTKGAINPVWGVRDAISRQDIQKVNFDIAVTISERNSGNAEGGIKVVALHIGGGVAESTETSNISRIQFSIPIVPPVTTIS